ncbi:MAG TPA: hypothetical protein PLF81_04975 [Candidatus Anammoximicrobium sp.]|nr:hypothetical protein [Candidatus Anammoximicrobium sp.]
MRITGMFGVFMLLMGTAYAQDSVYQFAGMNDVEAAFASQQQEIDSLRAELASLRSMGGDEGDKLTSGDCCGYGSGLEGGLELLYLDVYANHGGEQTATGNAWFDGFDFTAAGRFWFGYQGPNGLGVRARYYNFDGDSVVANQFVDLQMYDLEMTAKHEACNFDFLFIGGLRGGEIDWSDEEGWGAFGFDGIGPTLGLQARRPLFRSVAAVAGVRYSALFGNINDEQGDQANDCVTHITEVQLGVEWRRGMFVARAMYEYQWYTGLSGNVDNDIDPEDVDITLAGPVFTVGFER